MPARRSAKKTLTTGGRTKFAPLKSHGLTSRKQISPDDKDILALHDLLLKAYEYNDAWRGYIQSAVDLPDPENFMFKVLTMTHEESGGVPMDRRRADKEFDRLAVEFLTEFHRRALEHECPDCKTAASHACPGPCDVCDHVCEQRFIAQLEHAHQTGGQMPTLRGPEFASQMAGLVDSFRARRAEAFEFACPANHDHGHREVNVARLGAGTADKIVAEMAKDHALAMFANQYALAAEAADKAAVLQAIPAPLIHRAASENPTLMKLLGEFVTVYSCAQ